MLTQQATWRGGPPDGITIEVLRGEPGFPCYEPTLGALPRQGGARWEPHHRRGCPRGARL